MHPSEVGHAKGTGRLLHLCLPGSQMEVGEQFDDALLWQWLHASRPGKAAPRTCLLYPALPNMPAPAFVADGETELPIRLVIIDATWRQSRQMLTAHSALAQLPRLALHDVPTSRYAIRKAHAPHQLSTLEAAHLALQLLEPAHAGIPSLDQAMQDFMALQRPFWPHLPHLLQN